MPVRLHATAIASRATMLSIGQSEFPSMSAVLAQLTRDAKPILSSHEVGSRYHLCSYPPKNEDDHMTAKQIIRRFALLLALTCFASSADAQEALNFGSRQYAPFGPMSTPDWQWFAPVVDEAMESREHEGYFFSAERLYWSLYKGDRAPIGVETQLPVRSFYSDTVLHQSVDLIQGAVTAPRLTVVGTATEVASTNSIDSASTMSQNGWGNRFELGWVAGKHGWMVSVIDGMKFHSSQAYGIDDKRLRQLGGAQGLDGVDGIQGNSNEAIFLNLGIPGIDILPVAPTPGLAPLLPVDGLVTVHVLFEDPFGLLSAFIDNTGPLGVGLADGLPDDISGPGGIPDGVVDAFDTVRVATVFDQVTVEHQSEVRGVEVMSIRRKKRLYHGGHMEMFLGARYFEFDDRFSVEMLGNVLADSFVRSQNMNRLVGPQFGLRTYKRHGRWRLEFEGRGFFAANFLSIKQHGEVGSLMSPGQPLQPSALAPTSSFHLVNNEQFSPMGEFRAEAALQLTRDVAFNVGWTGLFAGGISRANNSVRYRLPDYGIVQNKEDLIIQGVSFGLEVNR